MRQFLFLFESQPLTFKDRKVNQALKVLMEEKTVMKEVVRILKQIENFTAFEINREISAFVYEKFRKDNRMTSQTVYVVLKFLVCGKEVKQFFGDVAEFVGREEVVRRIEKNLKLLEGALRSVRKQYLDQSV